MKTVEIIYRYDGSTAAPRLRPADSASARERLNAGNRAFATMLQGLMDDNAVTRRIIQVSPQDLGLPETRDGPEQRPYAAIVGCSDARVPVELIFNEGLNDLFVVRIAGNCLGSDVLGSLNYAIEHLGGSIKIIAVLGHSGCGAVSSAVDVFLDPTRYLALATSHALRTILDRLLAVVQASARRMDEMFGIEIRKDPGYRAALIEAAVVTSAALAAFTLQEEINSDDGRAIQAVYGVYLLETREVWAPQRNANGWSGLADPPGTIAGFAELGETVLRSKRITSLLTSKFQS